MGFDPIIVHLFWTLKWPRPNLLIKIFHWMIELPRFIFWILRRTLAEIYKANKMFYSIKLEKIPFRRIMEKQFYGLGNSGEIISNFNRQINKNTNIIDIKNIQFVFKKFPLSWYRNILIGVYGCVYKDSRKYEIFLLFWIYLFWKVRFILRKPIRG